MEEEKKTGTSKKKKIVITVMVVVLLAVIAALGFIIYKLLHKEPEDRGVSEGLVTKEEERKEGAMFTTDMNMDWYFPSGGRTSSNADIRNSEYNDHPVFFEIYLNDEEQTLLYSSPVIPVGQRLKKLKLDKTLPDGMYTALCTYHLLKNDDLDEEVSRVSFEVTLIFGTE